MQYTYPAVITKPQTSKFYLAYFPDFDRMTQGNDMTDIMKMAEDLLNLIVIDFEDAHQELPTATDISKLKAEDGQFVTMILADSDKYRKDLEKANKSVKKTLSIPSWLNEKALAEGINFSKTLQEALIEKLGL